MTKPLILLLLLLTFYTNNAQIKLSVYSEVSLITSGPGDEIYSAFGHSAIRVKDPVLNLDLIYNYGVFDFNKPNFVLNFAKGILIYSVLRYDFKHHLNAYKIDKRWVKEQVLNLTQEEKQSFFNFLEESVLPENKDYLYDPYYNNCSTKLRDITRSILGDNLVFNFEKQQKNLTFRKLTNNEIYWNSWKSLGINLATGTSLDKIAKNEQYMFLPKYLYISFKNGVINRKGKSVSIVKKENSLLNYKENKPATAIFSPIIIFSLLLILVLYITFRDIKKNKITKILDFLLFFTTGFTGLIVAFLWLFTDHKITPNNFNFLWAFAPNIIVAFFVLKNSQNIRIAIYIKLLILLLIVITVLWIFKTQSFPITSIPLLIMLFVRYCFLIRRQLY